MRTLIRDFTRGPVFLPLVTFSVPFMLSNALQVLYNVVDMVIVGRFLGSAGLAAVSNATRLFHLLMMMCLGLSMSGQVYISQLLGAGRRRELNTAIGTFFSTIFGVGVIVSILGCMFSTQVLRMVGVPEEIFSDARSYFLVCAGGIVFSYGYNCVSAVLRGMGDSKRPFLFIAIASVLNIVLDIVFIRSCGWGVAGAAFATILSQALSFVFALVYLYRRREAFGFDFRPASFRIDPAIFRSQLRLGVPFVLRFGAINVSMLFVIRLVNSLGVTAAAVFGAGVQLDDIVTKVTQGIMMAATAMVGQNFGAGKFDRVRKTVEYSWLFGAGFYILFTFFLLTRTEAMFRIFTDDKEVLALSHTFARNIVWQFPALILMRGTNGFINGIGNARLGLVFSILDGFVLRIGCSYLLGTVCGMGFRGFVLGYAVAAYGMSVPGVIYFYLCPWQRRNVVLSPSGKNG